MKHPISSSRPWGRFEQFTINEPTTVKLIYVRASHKLSYQYHKKRSEFWKVVRGSIYATLDGRRKRLEEGGTIRIPKLAKHRMEGIADSVVLEIAYGVFDEKDIVRLDDEYGRS